MTADIRSDPDARGGLAFFEWALAEHGNRVTPRIWRAVSRLLGEDDPAPSISPSVRIRPALGIWAENDWDTMRDSFRRAGLRIDNPNTLDEIRDAVGEWLAYRAQREVLPPGFEALEDYYLRHLG